MKKIIIPLLFFILSGCTNPVGFEVQGNEIRLVRDNPAFKAATYLGYTETTHRAELKELTGVDPKRTEWCAAFVNAVLEESGIESNRGHAYPLTARAYLDWGEKVSKSDIEPGDIVVFPRGNVSWQGHVGFFIREADINGKRYYYILGGNQNNKVSIALYRADRALGIRRNTSF